MWFLFFLFFFFFILEFDLGEIHLEMFLQMFSEVHHTKIMWLKPDFFVFEHKVDKLSEWKDWLISYHGNIFGIIWTGSIIIINLATTVWTMDRLYMYPLRCCICTSWSFWTASEIGEKKCYFDWFWCFWKCISNKGRPQKTTNQVWCI